MSYNLRWDSESDAQGDFKLIEENGADAEAGHFIYTGIAKLNFAYALQGGFILNENRFIEKSPDLNYSDANEQCYLEF